MSLFPDSVPAGHTLHQLGDIELVDGETAELSFEATAETVGFTIVADSGPDSFVGVVELTSPDGMVFTQSGASDDPAVNNYFAGWSGPSSSINRAVPRPHTSAMMVPNSPQVAMTPGRWTFRVRAERVRYDFDERQYNNEPVEGSVRVGVVERLEAVPDRGAVRFLFAFAADVGVDAASAESDAMVMQTVETLRTVLATANIEIDSIEYVDAPDLPVEVELDARACLGGDDLNRALVAAPPANGQIRVLFTHNFGCSDWSSNEMRYYRNRAERTAGVSNGIPGIPGSDFDGIVVGVDLLRQYPIDGSLVAAHEVGHFLGLFHSCEPEVFGVCDSLDDTPDDYTSGGSGPAGSVGENIMVSNVSLNTNPSFSLQQGHVMRSTAYVRPLQ